MQITNLSIFFSLLEKLAKEKLYFSVYHNSEKKFFCVKSVTDCDKIKFLHPEFNIYLLDKNTKIVEFYYYYQID